MSTPVRATPIRAALYLRVSTGRQADSDLSIPDQRRQAENFCKARGWEVVADFVEPGQSATDDRRPEFQRMIDAATTKPPAFETIVVHSYSRFFRDQFQLEFYVRRLAKNGVRLVSNTQELGDDPMSNMIRQIMALSDEYQSRENAKHTLREMKENARQGYWNGSRAPIGYRIVEAGQRGQKTKKTLEIDPIQAETVRLIFKLAREGDGTSGAMGVKSIVTYLNANNIRTRDGGRWGLGALHKVLTRTTYIGRHQFNTHHWKTSERKPETEIVDMAVPPIIDAAQFEEVQALLKSRSPALTAPRVVSGLTLLTGICFCAGCGMAVILRSDHYYTCSTKARQGETGCKGRTVLMEKFDALVASASAARFRSSAMCSARRSARSSRRWRTDADRAAAEIERVGPTLTPQALATFARQARKRMRDAKGGYRRDHLRALAQRVEVVVPTEIRIMGSKTELLQTLAAAASVVTATRGVRNFMPKWRTQKDSNLFMRNI